MHMKEHGATDIMRSTLKIMHIPMVIMHVLYLCIRIRMYAHASMHIMVQIHMRIIIDIIVCAYCYDYYLFSIMMHNTNLNNIV